MFAMNCNIMLINKVQCRCMEETLNVPTFNHKHNNDMKESPIIHL
jgi:hypothetical protein